MMGPSGYDNYDSRASRGGPPPDMGGAPYEEDYDRERRRESRRRDKDRPEKRRDSRERRSSRRDDDRGYDRDGGRDSRRHRDDRDDRRGRDGGGDRDRDRRRSRSRDHRSSRRSSRSASPRSSSRRQTVVPIHLREKKLNNWDVPPAAYPGMTATEVKLTGHFPLPGQPGRTTTGFGGFDMFGAKMSQGATGPVALSASLARQARRLYCGNIPYGVGEDGLMQFFNGTMSQLNVTTASGDPCIAVQINHEKNYAFVEFRSHEEATAAMAFDGINFNGQSLKLRRPKDYQPPAGASGTPPPIHVPGVISTNVPDSPNKIFVGGLPPFLNEEQVIELLKSFGELRAFNLVKDGLSGLSKGFAFCEYVDPGITDIACQGLNGMELGDKKLVVQRASVGANRMGMPGMPGMGGFPMMGMPAPLLVANGPAEPTTVILLLNMVTVDELVDDQEYQDILEDVREECAKFGTVVDITIPRPISGRTDVPGVGKIFVKFENLEQSEAALKALGGRKFDERTVISAYFSEEQYASGQF